MVIGRLIKEFIYRLRGDHTTENLVKRGLKVGQNFQRLHGSIIDPAHCWLITIGDNVTLAPNVHILAHDASTCFDLGYAKIGRVNIGNNVFIGAGSIILPNVNIGNKVIIGAGSVVTGDIDNNTVCAGNPAKVICSYEDYINKYKKKMQTSAIYDESYTLRNKKITTEQKNDMYKALDNDIGFVK